MTEKVPFVIGIRPNWFRLVVTGLVLLLVGFRLAHGGLHTHRDDQFWGGIAFCVLGVPFLLLGLRWWFRFMRAYLR